MKTFLVLSIALTALSSAQAFEGGVVGNGGDPVALEFKADALKAIQQLQSKQAKLPVSFASLKRAANESKVIVVDDPLKVTFDKTTQVSAAENFADQNLIEVNRSAWAAIQDPRLKQALALHEVLSLLGVESTGIYSYSSQFAVNNDAAIMAVAPAANAVTVSPCLPPQQAAQDLFKMIANPAATPATLQTYLNQHPVAPNVLNEHCETAAMSALYQKRSDLLDVLLQQTHPDINHVQNSRLPITRQRSLYAYAVYFGTWETILKLRNMGGSLAEMIRAKAYVAGTTDLRVAATANTLDVVQHMIAEGGSVNAAAIDGQTPLMDAAANNTLEVMKFLLSAGANYRAVDNLGWTPLTYAARYCTKSPADMLKALMALGLDINIKSKEGFTPLFYSLKNTPAMTRELLVAGADVNLTDRMGNTFLSYALPDLSPELIPLVIQSGGVNHLATPKGDPLQCVYIQSLTAGSLKVMFDAGADPNAVLKTKPFNGITCLMAAILTDKLDSMQVLLTAGARVNTEEGGGFSPLLIATQSKQDSQQMVQMLLAAGADPNHAESKDGQTPLFSVQDKETAALLIQAGGDINRADYNGNTPLIYASLFSSDDLVSYFVSEAGADKELRNKNANQRRDRKGSRSEGFRRLRDRVPNHPA